MELGLDAVWPTKRTALWCSRPKSGQGWGGQDEVEVGPGPRRLCSAGTLMICLNQSSQPVGLEEKLRK